MKCHICNTDNSIQDCNHYTITQLVEEKKGFDELPNETNLTSTLNWYLKTNPTKTEMLLTNPKGLILEAMKAENEFIQSIILDENKVNAVVEYLAPRVYKALNK